jgi:hypothetical protein
LTTGSIERRLKEESPIVLWHAVGIVEAEMQHRRIVS